MATRPTVSNAATAAAVPASFEPFGGLCAILAGAAGLLYAVAFVVLRNDLLSAVFLMLGGLLSTAALVAVYNRLREVDAGFARWAALLSVTGALGAAVYGGYDLAIVARRPASVPDLPSPMDPRGLLTFGLAGLGLFALSWLMGRSALFPRGLGQLGYALAVLLVALYLSRLIIFDARNPLVVVLAVLSGFLANPIWYAWLGLVFWRDQHA